MRLRCVMRLFIVGDNVNDAANKGFGYDRVRDPPTQMGRGSELANGDPPSQLAAISGVANPVGYISPPRRSYNHKSTILT